MKGQINRCQGCREGHPSSLCEYPASLNHWSRFQVKIPTGNQLEGTCASAAGQESSEEMMGKYQSKKLLVVFLPRSKS